MEHQNDLLLLQQRAWCAGTVTTQHVVRICCQKEVRDFGIEIIASI